MAKLRFLEYRAELGDLCNELGFRIAVEIGTHQGCFADQFLARFLGALICIDPYIGEGLFHPSFVEHSPSREFDYKIAQTVLQSKYPGRATFTKDTSMEASEGYPDESVDFVYLDGPHTVPHVKQDIITWYKKLKPGGILAGHDYYSNPLKAPELAGVVAVVNWFVVEYELELFLTTKEEIPSWYVQKP